MNNKQEYIARLTRAIETSHHCKATHRRTVTIQGPVSEFLVRQVEIFWLTGHPKSKRCFAWVEPSDSVDPKIITILETPSVIGPATALKTARSSGQL